METHPNIEIKDIRAVEELLNNGDLRKNISQNAIAIREELSASKIAEKWLNYIKTVVD